MTQVFISHVEEDRATAEALAEALERDGYTTWYYERDSVPGPSYLQQIIGALADSTAVILLVSHDALNSWQVDREVIQAHEMGKPFVPLLRGMTHAALREGRPDWSMILGAATSLPIPEEGLAPLLPRLMRGLRAIEGGARAFTVPVGTGASRRGRSWFLRRRRVLVPVALILAAAAIASTIAIMRYTPTPADPVAPACCGAVYVKHTGHNLAGPFLHFWQRYGGLDTFGYPRTEVFVDHGRLLQYTDRFLLEQVGGRMVTAPLGRLLTTGRAFGRVAPFPPGPTRLYFPATGHSLTDVFLHYWRTHAGAVLLGAPISELDMEPNGDSSGGRVYQVQWFENGRMEYHPENVQARYQVELGLTGDEVLHRLGWLH